jgi:hypothetical protein
MLANPATSSLVTIVVEPVNSRSFAHDNRTTRTTVLSEALAAEDPRVIASALAHELQHSLDIDLALFGVVPGDCLTVEARGFATQAVVGRAVYGDKLPHGTEHERDLSAIAGAMSGSASRLPGVAGGRPVIPLDVRGVGR